MGDLLQWILPLLIGAVITIVISRYFFRESLRSSIKVLLHKSSQIFAGVDADVRKKLMVRFGEDVISDLVVLELLIANDGRHPISNYIHPLTITCPDQTRILDASPLHVHPPGRDVHVEHDAVKCTISFEVLNPNDFVLLKLLFEGGVKSKDLKVEITAENLPPRLEISHDEYDTSPQKTGVEWLGLVLSTIVFLIGTSLVETAWLIIQRDSFSFIDYITLNFFGTLAIVVTGLFGTFLAAVGFGLMIASVVGGSLPRRHHYPLPEALHEAYARAVVMEFRRPQ